MSKGGAGKVYFVLYLAVILELLIIFIERDEAEEHLRRQQREAIAIVQTILSQLQTGAGVTSVTTRPKDNITLSDKDPESTVRVYDILVAVGDSTSRAGDVAGDDVNELTYKVSHIGDPNIPEEELPLDTTDLTEPFFIAQLGELHGGMFEPRQIKGAAAPTGDPTAYFQLNEEMTAQEQAKGRNVKVFRVNFKPNAGEGWYRLRFESSTNQIMGVATSEPSDEDTVRIGNVQLTVKQLRSVQEFLKKGGEDDPGAAQVKQYIEDLLDPERWKDLDVNKGANAIDVRVVRPDIPPPSDPIARINFPRQEIYWYDGAPFQIPVAVGPSRSEGGSYQSNVGAIQEVDGQNYIVWSNPEPGPPIEVQLTARNSAGKSATDSKTLYVERPTLTKEWRRLPASRATIGSKYRPDTEWQSTQIPPEHYQTVVLFGNKEVFSKRGTQFNPPDLPEDLNVTATSGPIKTTVYWLPNGNPDREGWVPILSTDPSVSPIVAEYDFAEVDAGYKAPVYDGQYEFTFPINGRTWTLEWDGIVANQVVGPGQVVGVQSIDASCNECAEYGFSQPRVTQIDDYTWKLFIEVVDKQKLASRVREVNGKSFPIDLTINGRGSSPGIATIDMVVRVGG